MKTIILNSKQLKSQLTIIKNKISPLTGKIGFFGNNNCLEIIVTDIESTIQLSSQQIGIDIKKIFLLDFKNFLKALSAFDSYIFFERIKNEIVISSDENTLQIKIDVEEPDQFWKDFLDNNELFENQLDINSEDFKHLINCVYNTIAADDSRWIMNGCLFSEDDIVTTDGKRLTKITHNLPFKENEFEKFVLPRNSLGMFISLIKNNNELITLMQSKNGKIVLKTENVNLISQVIEGEFPNYSQVIPDESNCLVKFELNTKEFLKDARKISKLIDKKPGAFCILEIKNNIIKIISSKGNSIKCEIELNLGWYDIKLNHLEIGFDIDYLIQMVADLNSKTVTIKLTDENILIIKNPSDENYIGILMPIKIKDKKK